MKSVKDKIKKYKQLAEKKPKYYALIGDLYMDEADFKTAAVYYKKAIEMYGKAVENGEKAGLEGIKNVYAKMNKQTT